MYRKLIILAALLTFCVVVLGAYVRLSDAGLGCPDWPGCYGHITPAHAAEHIAAAEAVQPHGPVSLPKAWKEMVHRYFASTLGFLIIGIAAIAWFRRRTLKQSPTLPIALIGLVIFQGLLGMWTVTLLLKPVIVTAHLFGGLSLLALLTVLALRQFKGGLSIAVVAPRSLQWLAVAGFVVLVTQIGLGGWVSTNYAALACSDFPLCQGVLMPKMDFGNAFHVVRELGMTAQGDLLSLEALTAIHWMHRVGAVVTSIVLGVLTCCLFRVGGGRGLGVMLLSGLVLQLLLGIGNIYLQLPLALAVAHNAGAALLVVILVVVNFALRRVPSGAQHSVIEPSRAMASIQV
ncbi:MAG TPA: COX15/CtaA family protein [Burkholderiales bacterium]|nr:COX15/CtaA family protein [Burkholderiales bacterium]